ncbi:hypothetical protein [Streptomyces sp. NPDC020681]|uniref:hypothetical protein n=1 Tax=Streptomyces sp. NPDC020681 TaxID=3365083 RepID=UPI0037B840F6
MSLRKLITDAWSWQDYKSLAASGVLAFHQHFRAGVLPARSPDVFCIKAPPVLLFVDVAAGEPLGEQLLWRGPDMHVSVLAGTVQGAEEQDGGGDDQGPERIMLTDMANQMVVGATERERLRIRQLVPWRLRLCHEM